MPPETQPKPTLFLQEALANRIQEEEPQPTLAISPPWTWNLFWLLATATAMGLTVAVLGTVEVQRPGRGILRPAGGVRLLQAEVAGVLAQVHCQSGDHIQGGTPIARIQAAQVQSALLEADRHLELLQSLGQTCTNSEDLLMEQQMASIQARMTDQEAQVQSLAQSAAFQSEKVRVTAQLLEARLVSRMDLETARDRLNEANRQKDLAKQQLNLLHQELAVLKSARQRHAYQFIGSVHGAKAKRDALDASLSQTLIKAPVSGFLEALVAKPGDLLQAGQTVAKLIPEGAPLQVVAFLAEKDRAAVKVGDIAYLELMAYPASEFGTLRGRIQRIGGDLAPPYEIAEVLGEETRLEAPAFRVELEIAGRPRQMETLTLRPGMLLEARFVLRRQRIITLILAPLRRWLS